MIYPQSLAEVYLEAGKNKGNLVAVLEHYKKTREKEKYLAANFLLENISIHKSINYNWIDDEGKIIPFSELDFTDFDMALKAFERIKNNIKITPKQYIQKDVSVITSEFLIKNIDLAFYEWKNNPWSSSYDFKTFCEYILPYRSLIEPIDDWRENYKSLVTSALNEVEDLKDPTEVATQIILSLKDFSFEQKRLDPIPLLSPSQLLFRRQGSCPDLANLALLACRSLGVAVTFDFTPHYAASSNRHYFNTVVSAKKEHIPFNGNSVNTTDGLPYTYIPSHKRMGKVFRKTFSIQKTALASNISKKNIPEGFLQEKNLVDVTNEYVPIGEINYVFEVPDSIEIGYLNVFNKSKWKTIDWAKKTNGKFIYKNLGTDLIYLPSIYNNQRTIYEKYPILLDKQGKPHILKPDFKNTFECTLSRKNEYKNNYKENNSSEIEAGKKYLLMYWDGKWKKLGVSQANNEGVYFKNIPSNAVFRLIPKDYDGYERIFVLDNKTRKIRWY
ncbi:transglutaminase domain-containing protein [Flavivirga abyssicola]|uniref:transglutaminase domain-containing protein n=1 Tax=Flavivirga abyssicola TaxID=3063533 RepID=UPI0026E0EF00|nr:transglutaminase domain-containing protein [Flavivirga sp. MEBiC07777]WVK12558.1 transglutaminase domain-containing protein [Flavivirga sp. MEBiC07777]